MVFIAFCYQLLLYDLPLVAVLDVDDEEDGGYYDATGRSGCQAGVDGQVDVGVLELLQGAVLGRLPTVLPPNPTSLAQVQLHRHSVELTHLHFLPIWNYTSLTYGFFIRESGLLFYLTVFIFHGLTICVGNLFRQRRLDNQYSSRWMLQVKSSSEVESITVDLNLYYLWIGQKEHS